MAPQGIGEGAACSPFRMEVGMESKFYLLPILHLFHTSFVSTVGTAWKDPVYGGLFRINGNGEMPIPKGAYYMAGAGGQRTIIIPSKGLVVVRLGHHRGDEIGMKSLNSALSKLMEAF